MKLNVFELKLAKKFSSTNLSFSEIENIFNLENYRKYINDNKLYLHLDIKGKYKLILHYVHDKKEELFSYEIEDNNDIEINYLQYDYLYLEFELDEDILFNRIYYYFESKKELPSINIFYFIKENNNYFAKIVDDLYHYLSLNKYHNIHLDVISSSLKRFNYDSNNNISFYHISKHGYRDFYLEAKKINLTSNLKYDFEIVIDYETKLTPVLIENILSFLTELDDKYQDNIFTPINKHEFHKHFYINKEPLFSSKDRSLISYLNDIHLINKEIMINHHFLISKKLINKLDELIPYSPFYLTSYHDFLDNDKFSSINYLTCEGIFLETKWTGFNEYYYLINQFHLSSYLNKELSISYFKKLFKYYFYHYGMLYRYDYINACFKAVRDYLFKNNEEKVESEIYHLIPISRSPNETGLFYQEPSYLNPPKKSSFYHLVQLLTFNGQCFKSNKNVVYDICDFYLDGSFKMNKAIYYDFISNHSFVSEYDKKELNKLRKLFNNLLYQYKKSDKYIYPHLIKDYKDETNIDNTQIDNNKIVFYVGTRLGITCNPKYILLDLIKKETKYDLYWLAHKEELCKEYEDKVNVVPLSDKNKVYSLLNTAKIIIYNDSLPLDYHRQEGQILINTWHGGINYKKIGYKSIFECDEEDIYKFRKMNPCPNYFISGSKQFSETTSNSFMFPKETFLEIGLPRNDILINHNDELKKNIKKKLNIDKSFKVVTYIPTWRNDNIADIHDLDFKNLLLTLEKKFSGKWILIYRGHSFTVNFWKGIDNAIDLSNYPDTQEILLISDLLISDYSSVMWDALLLDLPVFSYAPDLDSYYVKERGFFIDINDYPCSIACSNKELFDNIMSYNHDLFIKKKQIHLKKMGSFDSGNATEAIVKLINEEMKK